MRLQLGGLPDVNVSDRTARDLGFVREFWYRQIGNSQAFCRAYSNPASAGNRNQIQLFNPAASSVTVVVRLMFIGSTTAQEIDVNQDNTAATNLLSTGINLNSGAAAATAQVRYANPAGEPGTTLCVYELVANQSILAVPDWFIQLGAGEGVSVVALTTNTQLACTFMWTEF